MAGDRTEKPTARRLREARKRGQLARSKDLADAFALMAVLGTLVWFGPTVVAEMAALLRDGLTRLDRGPTPLDQGQLVQLTVDSIKTLVALVGPFALAAAATSTAVSVMQGGWNVAPEAIGFRWERLSPANGIKRLGARAGLDTLKMLIAVGLIAWLAWAVVRDTLVRADELARVPFLRSAHEGWSHAERLIRQTVIVLVVLGAFDYLLQRRRLEQSLLMTKQEVKDDARMTEGNPEVKARIRRMQRDVMRRRMLAAVPKATVVITNPTEYAVALLYDREHMAAPQVVAKGKNMLAAKIRELARQHEVPIVENVPLAQALYRSTDVGGFIPAELFSAVAEVLAYLIRLRRLAY